jgi:hypothetical protein
MAVGDQDRDPKEAVRYGSEPGLDPITGRICRPLTSDLIERVREYEKGKRPSRIDTSEPTFFDARTGEPIVWYSKGINGDIELFDLMGFNPGTGEELLPVTKEIAAAWKAREQQQVAATPRLVDPQTYPFFDPKTASCVVLA